MKTGFTKMKRLAAIGLFALSALSFANVETNGPLDEEMFTKEVHQNKNYFETLQGMFKKGTLPEPSKLLGVLWSGRCFKKKFPYSPLNAAYHFRRVKNPDVGPLGDDVILYEALSAWAPSKRANHYDKMELSEFLSEYKKVGYSRVSKRDVSLVIEFDNTRSRLRSSGKYLVEQLSDREKDRDVGPLGDGQGEEAFTICYYFIPEYAR